MTVSQAVPIIDYVGNGVSTAFAFDFKVFRAADLEVTVAGVVVTNYSVSISTPPALGGTVNFIAAPVAAAAIRIKRVLPFERSTDYQQGGDLPEQTLDDDQDAPVMMIQQLAADVDVRLGSVLRVPDGESVPELAAAASRAGQLLGFNLAGGPVMVDPSTLGGGGGGGGGFANPMTATGDLIAGGSGGAATRLAVGSNGQVLTVVGGAPAWAAAAGGGGGSAQEAIQRSWMGV